MKKMFLEEAEPLLKEKLNLTGKKAVSRVIKVFGPGESQVEEMIKDVMDDPQGCSFALLASDGEIHVRITAEGEDQQASQRLLDGLTEKIKADMGAYIYGYDEDALVSVVAGLLRDKGLTLAVAESCTGGYLSKTITDLPGSSAYFWAGP
jgi:nicotinamide-nucleotide amidase